MSAAGDHRRGLRRAGGAVAVLLWAGYALPLFWPPPVTDCSGTAIGATVIERLFPDVPPRWVVLRLACLFAAAAVVALLVRPTVPDDVRTLPPQDPERPGRVAWIALAIAAAQVMAAVWAADFDRFGQLLYAAVLALPALLLWAAHRRAGAGTDRRLLAWLGVVVAAWVLLRVPAALHSPRAADAVDTLGAFTYLERTAASGFNVLTDRVFPGVASLFSILQGGGLYGATALPLTLPVLQVINVAWMAVAAIGVGVLGARLVSPAAGPVAAAFFLFSPFALLAPIAPIAIFLGALVATGLLLLLLAIRDRRAPPAIAAFGALAGFGMSHPTTLPITVALALFALVTVWQRPRASPLLVAVALLSFVAAVLPGVPTRAEIQTMRDSYTFGRRAWRPLEYILLGQQSPLDRPRFVNAGQSGPIDIPLAALLTPFAIPRTAVRLWGDSLYDPLGTGLVAVAMATALLVARRSALARSLLALLLVALLPGFLSSTDRASLTRTVEAHTILALFAAFGFDLVRRGFAPAQRPAVLAGAAILAIAIGGSVLFDTVNPRILPGSAVGIALEALSTPAQADAVMLDHSELEFEWLQIRAAATRVPARPLPVVPYAAPESLDALRADGGGRLVFWTPGLEQQHSVTAAVCARWPQARLYTLDDRTGCSHVLAAAVAGDAWRPALPADRWRAESCAGQVPPLPAATRDGVAAIARVSG